MRFVDVEPNNVESAMRYYRESVAVGAWSPDRARAVLGLQRNPDALIDAIAKARAAK